MPKSKQSSKGTSKGSYKSVPTALITPDFQGTDPDTLLFTEWSDQELNAEKWDLGKGPAKAGKDEKKQSETSSEATTKAASPPLPFRDPHSFTLPQSIKVYKWKKPEVLFPGKKLVIYKESSLGRYANFIDGSKHLFDSQFMRSFIACIGSLEYMGYTCPWPMEGISQCYTPNTLNEPWKPWHHIYSMCKAGKGQKHKPQVNKIGKYILRLYWVGMWRRIIIDDFLPVDRMNNILLPTVQVFRKTEDDSDSLAYMSVLNSDEATNKSAKTEKRIKDQQENEYDVIELWPFLLCKGILKFANMTWTIRREQLDCSIIHSLTGWVAQRINTVELDANEVWEICAAYTDHFKWAEDKSSPSLKSDKSAKSAKSKKGKEKKVKSEPDKVLPYCVIAQVMDLRQLESDVYPDIAPCWSHRFLISQIRNIPIIKPVIKPEIDRWKRFRWLDWARSQGVYNDEDCPLKYFKLVDFFNKVDSNVELPEPCDSEVKLPLKINVKDVDEKTKIETATRKGDKPKSTTKNEKLTSTKGSIKSKESKKALKVTFVPPPDPSFWIDFDQLSRYIEQIYIFFRPQIFQSHIVVTDCAEKKSSKGVGKPAKAKASGDRIEKKILWPYKMKETGNQPLYIFMDSLDYKTFVVSLSHAGNRKILEQKCLVVHCDLNSLWQKKFSITDRSSLRMHSNILFENFDWHSNTFGEFTIGMNTVGMKSYYTVLHPGRTVLRFWIKSSTSYNLTILSDSPVEIGTLEYIFEIMPSESERLVQLCYNFGTCFGNLVQSFGLENYREALHAFYHSYRPDNGIAKKQGMILDEALFKELEDIIKIKYSECGDIMFALRILFLRSDYGFQCPPRKKAKEKKPKKKVKEKKPEKKIGPPQWDDNECLSYEYIEESESDDDIKIEKARQWAASKIQAFFKMIYVRKLKKYQDPTDSSYMKTFETLKKVYKDVFNVDERVASFPQMFRNLLFKNEQLEGVLEKYTFHKDLYSVVNCQILSGNLECQPESWTVLGRYAFHVNSPLEETIRICLFCNVEKYVVRVFNNDTKEEVMRCVSKVSVANYVCNAMGYTILAYGWTNSNQRTVNYKFNLITLKRNKSSPLIIPEVQLKKVQISDVYHHNVNKIIGKCSLWVFHDTALTLRMSCSYNNVKIKLRCLDHNGKVLQEIEGMHNIIMPMVKLKYEAIAGQPSFISPKKSIVSSKSSVFGSRNKKRSTSERGSNAGSISSRGSRKDSRQSSVWKDETGSQFLIEAYVLKDSWPLTKEEWFESDRLLSRNLIGGFFSRSNSASSSRSLLKKMSEISKFRSLIEYDTLPDPKWSLQVLHDLNEPVLLKFNRKRAIEIRNVKLKWYEDSNRYEQSKLLRAQYLHEYSSGEDSETFMTSILYTGPTNSEMTTEDTHSPTYNFSIEPISESSAKIPRSHVRPLTASKLKLPAFDLSSYAYPLSTEGSAMETTSDSDTSALFWSETTGTWTPFTQHPCYKWENEPETKIKRPQELEQDLIDMEQAIDDFNWYHEEYISDMTSYREKALQKNQTLEEWFDGIQEESQELMNNAYHMRTKFIQKLADDAREKKAKLAAASPRNKGKKGKKETKKSKSPKIKSSKSSKSK